MRLRSFVWLLGFVALLWIVAIVDLVPGLDLTRYGVVPRDSAGLRGIPLHVFIHGGFGHLMANTFPLLILGGLTAFRGERVLLVCSAFIALFAGLGIWLLGRSAVHIGASGLVFGYFGYLVACGFIERGCVSIIISVAVTAIYGLGIFFGLLPLGGYVSWEGHLFGLIGGVLFARFTGPSGDDDDDKETNALSIGGGR